MVASRNAPIDFETIVALALRMAGVELGTAFGNRALKANGRLLACMATNKSAEPHSLCVRLSIPERDELVQSDPSVYYLTPHYTAWPCIVVRLARVHVDALNDLLRMSLRYNLSRPKARIKSRTETTKTRSPRRTTRRRTATNTRKREG